MGWGTPQPIARISARYALTGFACQHAPASPPLSARLPTVGLSAFCFRGRGLSRVPGGTDSSRVGVIVHWSLLWRYDPVHEGTSGGHVDAVLSTATEYRSGDRIDLRRMPRSHVFLHRASETVGHPFERREDRPGGDPGTLCDPDGAGLVDARLHESTQLRFRANGPERVSRRGRRQRKGRQKAELGPEHRDFVLADLAGQPAVAQLVGDGLCQRPRRATRRDLHVRERGEVAYASRPDLLCFDAHRSWQDPLGPVAVA